MINDDTGHTGGCEGLYVNSFSTFSHSAKHRAGSTSPEVGYSGRAEQHSRWGPCPIGDLNTSGCSGCTGLKRWPVFHSREFRTLQPFAVRQWLDLWAGAEPREMHRVTPPWLKVTSKPTSEPLTTPNPPGDNCALLWYRAPKWSWQSSIYEVIWARRMASTALAVFEFCPIEVPFIPSSCLCLSLFSFPSQPAFMQWDKKYTTCTWNDEIWPAHGRQSRSSYMVLHTGCTGAPAPCTNFMTDMHNRRSPGWESSDETAIVVTASNVFSECNLMTECSVHAELLSSSYESPGSRCSARTRLFSGFCCAWMLRLQVAAWVSQQRFSQLSATCDHI